ncbi:MAG: chromate transporter [Spirochaetia bacterium]|nr:chromate transporter [Spirochaetia bacterium]
MILPELFLLFAKIGLFAFGGGYANLAVIESELLIRNWCTASEFADIVAVAQVTPGPVVINAATYIGKQLAGIPGGIVATLGFVFPSIAIILCITLLADRFSGCSVLRHGIRGVRAGMTGLLICAVIFFLENSILDHGLGLKSLVYDFSGTVEGWRTIRIVVPAMIIFAINFIFAKKFKLSIYLSVIFSVIIGTPLMYFYNIYF